MAKQHSGFAGSCFQAYDATVLRLHRISGSGWPDIRQFLIIRQYPVPAGNEIQGAGYSTG
jgi:hypothetical protein